MKIKEFYYTKNNRKYVRRNMWDVIQEEQKNQDVHKKLKLDLRIDPVQSQELSKDLDCSDHSTNHVPDNNRQLDLNSSEQCSIHESTLNSGSPPLDQPPFQLDEYDYECMFAHFFENQ